MRIKSFAAHALVLGSLLVAGSGPASATSPELISLLGGGYSQLSAAWWQWLYSFPASQNPQFAQGATDCSVRQSGPIWFLAASATGTDTFVRSCTIPKHKALFFPVLNASWVNEPTENLTVAEKRDLLDGVISDLRPGFLADLGLPGSRACRLEVKIDGEISTFRVPTVRVQSPTFRAIKPTTVDPEAVSDGFWVLLPPLNSGQHTLHIRGEFCEFDNNQTHPIFGGVDVTYHLNVQ